MTLEALAEEIRKLKPEEREELFRIAGMAPEEDDRRGGPNDPLSKLIGMVKEAKGSGSEGYKEDLYGGDSPL